MAIEMHKLTQYLLDLRTAYGESVYNGRPIKELNKIEAQIKHIEQLIQNREDESEGGRAK